MNFPTHQNQNLEWEKIIAEISPVIRKAIHKHLYKQNTFLIEDIEQEIVIKVYNNFSQYDQDKSLQSWVYCIAVNHIWDVLRKQKRKNKFVENKSSLQDPIFNDFTFTNIAAYQLLNLLPEMYRDILMQKYHYGYKQREIANKLNISIGTVSTRLQTGIKKLKILIKGEALSQTDLFN